MAFYPKANLNRTMQELKSYKGEEYTLNQVDLNRTIQELK